MIVYRIMANDRSESMRRIYKLFIILMTFSLLTSLVIRHVLDSGVPTIKSSVDSRSGENEVVGISVRAVLSRNIYNRDLLTMSEGELICYVCNPGIADHRRSAAARELGDRKSVNAIRVLVDRINYQGTCADDAGLEPASVGDSLKDTLLSRYPCMDALTHIGWPSMPVLVDEYIRISNSPTIEDDVARRRIRDTILIQGNRRMAICFISVIYLFCKQNTNSSHACKRLIAELWEDRPELS
jgi:hypothetical protein